MTNSWRALAQMARDRIVTTNPEELNLILGVSLSPLYPLVGVCALTVLIIQLWYLRLSSIARLRLYNQTSAELTNLFTVLNGVAPLSAREWLFDRLLPFELEVMYARVKYWAGDHMGYLDALNALLKKCRGKARAAKGDEAIRAMWRERGARVCLIMASQLVEMKVRLFRRFTDFRMLKSMLLGFCGSCSPPRAAHQSRPHSFNLSPPIIDSSNIPPSWLPRQSISTFCCSRSRSEREPRGKGHERCTFCECRG